MVSFKEGPSPWTLFECGRMECGVYAPPVAPPVGSFCLGNISVPQMVHTATAVTRPVKAGGVELVVPLTIYMVGVRSTEKCVLL